MNRHLSHKFIGNVYKNILTGAYQTCVAVYEKRTQKGLSLILDFDVGQPVFAENISTYLELLKIDENAN